MSQTVVFIHWLIAQDGWEEVAQGCIDWLTKRPRSSPAQDLRSEV